MTRGIGAAAAARGRRRLDRQFERYRLQGRRTAQREIQIDRRLRRGRVRAAERGEADRLGLVVDDAKADLAIGQVDAIDAQRMPDAPQQPNRLDLDQAGGGSGVDPNIGQRAGGGEVDAVLVPLPVVFQREGTGLGRVAARRRFRSPEHGAVAPGARSGAPATYRRRATGPRGVDKDSSPRDWMRSSPASAVAEQSCSAVQPSVPCVNRHSATGASARCKRGKGLICSAGAAAAVSASARVAKRVMALITWGEG